MGMSQDLSPTEPDYPTKFFARKDDLVLPDSLPAWITHYHQLAIVGVRSQTVSDKILLHLQRFTTFFQDRYGHDRISACLRRDVAAWQHELTHTNGLAAATVNNHLASLSAFTTWVQSQAPTLFAAGDPVKGISERALPPLEPRTLSDDQVRSLKNLCDRLPRLHQLKGRRWIEAPDVPIHGTRRPWRDRAIVFVLLSTGLRREELIRLNRNQIQPSTPAELRIARKAVIRRVSGKGKSERSVFLSADARLALADYLEREWLRDADTPAATALFLTALATPRRSEGGRLAVRTVNAILEQIGRWHDAEVNDPERQVMPLRPHDLRHTFAFQLARTTGADAYELERRLGHRSQRYIQRYTNPPEDVAATYVEGF
jgi:integrase